MTSQGHDQPEGNAAPSESWCAPLIAFIAWLFNTIANLKRVRRHTSFKPDWRSHFPDLIRSEWHRDQLLAHGAALILSGKSLDTPTNFQPLLDPPPGYGGPRPSTPFELNRRFLALARWLKDPEAMIRRHAARIAKRASRADHRRLSSLVAQRRGRWIARSCARDGGGSREPALHAQPRAPPASPRNTHTPPPRATRETAPARPIPSPRFPVR